MTSFLLTVHQGKEKHVLELAAGSSVGDVQRALNVTAGVLPADQRLLFKGKEPNSASLLADLGVSIGHLLRTWESTRTGVTNRTLFSP